jgi:heme/copper-type cytochrome/quinol oxidase subunit 2
MSTGVQNDAALEWVKEKENKDKKKEYELYVYVLGAILVIILIIVVLFIVSLLYGRKKTQGKPYLIIADMKDKNNTIMAKGPMSTL